MGSFSKLQTLKLCDLDFKIAKSYKAHNKLLPESTQNMFAIETAKIMLKERMCTLMQ